jgi:hypothetical protein
MLDIHHKYFVVGLSASDNADKVRNVVCPEGGCPRGLIPPGSWGAVNGVGGGGGVKTYKGGLPVGIKFAAAIEFDSELEVDNWLESAQGQNYSLAFETVIIIRSSR